MSVLSCKDGLIEEVWFTSSSSFSFFADRFCYCVLVNNDVDYWENNDGFYFYSFYGSIGYVVTYNIAGLSWAGGIVNNELDYPAKKLGFVNGLFF